MPSPLTVLQRQRTLWSHRIHRMPVVVLMPHSRCNCRCVMCDIWKANANKQELTAEDLSPQVDFFRQLEVEWFVLSGGEALMHKNLWTLCEVLRGCGDPKITLLSTGLLLRAHAAEIVDRCHEVIVSLDGSPAVHDAIRNIPRAFDKLADGVAALREADPSYRVTARCVLQRRNFDDLPNIIRSARDIGLDQISFLGADVSSEAFNRPDAWEGERVEDVALERDQVDSFDGVMEATLREHAEAFSSGFVAESPEKMRRIVQYYRAVHGDGDFPPVRCNAPWTSTVIEADGTVRPCFFHPAFGNLRETPLAALLNSPSSIAWRRGLDMDTDPTCKRCVCTLHLSPWERL